MEPDFWHQRWQNNEIGFHLSEANPILVKHFSVLGLGEGQRVFIPLCGKTRDIGWLLRQGVSVVGAELSALAVDQLFADLDITPVITQHDSLLRYQFRHSDSAHLDVFVGDVFCLSAHLLGKVDAIYDRAALVALPHSLRGRYSAHLMLITQCAPQLLIAFDYDQTQMDGPPFSVNHDEVTRHYGDYYTVDLLQRLDIPGGLKGVCAADELVYHLK
jgi:thiopurine S-methyltransferase